MKLTKPQTADLIERGDIVSIKGRQFIALEVLEALEAEQKAGDKAVAPAIGTDRIKKDAAAP